jgi:nitroimidazol reductase NimA-like FMN-containing flavoprotein (pyridoxamine 5'-phosphate oxidase superfamily)
MNGHALQELSREECLGLLAACHFGRLVVNSAGSAIIRPVNYVYDAQSQSVALRTDLGAHVHAYRRATHATFEVDDVDAAAGTGWSVIVRGTAEEVHSPAERRRLERLGLDPWAPGEKRLWLRIRARTVSGRRVTNGEVLDAQTWSSLC